MRSVKVPLGKRSYSIEIGPDLLAGLGAECARLGLGRRCAIIADAHVAPLYGELARASLAKAGFEVATIDIPAGETAKLLKTVHACYDRLAEHRIERQSFVVALGGGVTGDMAGFVAATYLRGINFIQVPTTLLAQVDSSVGGKVGVNLKAGKNLVGAFYQPRLVLCDLSTLSTLPEREFRAGMAEVIKYGVIYDAPFFERLEKSMPQIMARDPAIMAEVIARCCEIKADVVGQDETESGLRAILNFGHTVGHALEAITGYGTYLHGEALAIGLVAAAKISEKLTGFSSADSKRLAHLLEQVGLPVSVRLTAARQSRLLAAMQLDKKVSGGEVKFVLARKIGQVSYGQRVPQDVLIEVLKNISAGAGR
jgi:3-dehydroquinate synthase